ncbi:transposase [Streptomyces globisporus]|nr:transposase [Streptomyces globisporus]
MIRHGQDSIAGLIIDLVAGRGELTDAAWRRTEPLLPQVDGRVRPWRDHRQVVNGVLWRLRTGAPWRDPPDRFGPWQTVYERFARWEADGTRARLLEHVQVRDDAVGPGGMDRLRRLHHQPSPPARSRRPQKGDANGDELEDPGGSQARQASAAPEAD